MLFEVDWVVPADHKLKGGSIGLVVLGMFLQL